MLTDSLVYIPLWFLNHFASWGLLGGTFLFILFLGWCLGESYNN